jgi:hypothetical protein
MPLLSSIGLEYPYRYAIFGLVIKYRCPDELTKLIYVNYQCCVRRLTLHMDGYLRLGTVGIVLPAGGTAVGIMRDAIGLGSGAADHQAGD